MSSSIPLRSIVMSERPVRASSAQVIAILSKHAFRDAFARAQVVNWVRSGWLGALARDVGLFGMLDAYYDHKEAVELAIYRAHHAEAATSASPVALDLLRHLGFDPYDLVHRLRPDGTWRHWVCGSYPLLARRFAHRWKGRTPPVLQPWADRHAFLYGGFVERGWLDPSGALGIRLSPAGLEVGARIGLFHLRTIGDVGTITTKIDIPETVKHASIGRPLDVIYDHPALRGRGYVVEDQSDLELFAGDPRPAWRIQFRAPHVPWRVPWAE